MPAPTRSTAALVTRDIVPALLMVALLAGCGDDGGELAAEARWRVVSEGLPGALFSVTGTSAEDVWVVGADRGMGPTLLHYDGSSWQVHETSLEAVDLFWVHAFEDGPVFAAGTEGTLLRYEGDAFETLATPAARNVWGVWGATSDDVWAVGGDPNEGQGFVWRDRGDGFEVVELGDELPAPPAWYKVWGSAEDDVWFCGVDGALMHFDGEAFEAIDSGTSRTLLTIHGLGDGSRVTAVGGQFSATLVSSSDGEAFRDVTPEGPPLQTFGVFHRGRDAYSVGMQTTVLHDDGSGWVEQSTNLDLFQDFHAVWIDPEGGVWAVGGQIIAPPFTSGTLIHKGAIAPPGVEL